MYATLTSNRAYLVNLLLIYANIFINFCMGNNKIRLLAMYLTDTSRTEGINTRMDKEASFVSLILICFDSLLGYNVQAAYYKP